MQKMLIADSSRPFVDGMEAVFQDRYQVIKAYNGITALALLRQHRPDVVVINLLLPYKDGLTLLQESDFQPHIILAITSCVTTYLQRAILDMGIDYTLIMPSVKTAAARLEDLLRNYTVEHSSRQAAMLHHLKLLSIPTHLEGYRQLCAAIPLFADNPQQFLTKELYPAVARQCGCRDGSLVEHSMRKAIHDGWRQRDPAVWRKYFPSNIYGNHKCPSNKVFLCVLAELLDNLP